MEERPPWRRVGSVYTSRTNICSSSALERAGGIRKWMPCNEYSKQSQTSIPRPESASTSHVLPAAADTCMLGNDGSLTATDSHLEPNHQEPKSLKEPGDFINPYPLVNTKAYQNLYTITSLLSATHFLELCNLESSATIQNDRQDECRDDLKMENPTDLRELDLPCGLNDGEKRNILNTSSSHNISSPDHASQSVSESSSILCSTAAISTGSLEPLKEFDATNYNATITVLSEDDGTSGGQAQRRRSSSPAAAEGRFPSGDPLGCGAHLLIKSKKADAAVVAALEREDPRAASLASSHARDPTTIAAYAAARSLLPLNAAAQDEDLYSELYPFLLFLYHLNPNASIVPNTVAMPKSCSSIPSLQSCIDVQRSSDGEGRNPLVEDSEAEGKDDGAGGGTSSSEEKEKWDKTGSRRRSRDDEKPCGAGPNWRDVSGGRGGREPGGKRPCHCKPRSKRPPTELTAQANSVVAAVTTVAAYVINAACTEVPGSTSERPVMVTGVVEARCVEDGEARSVALFKKEPGGHGKVGTAAGTTFSCGLPLPDNISLLAVKEKRLRRPAANIRGGHGISEMSDKYGADIHNVGGAHAILEPCENCICCDVCKHRKCTHEENPSHPLNEPLKETSDSHFFDQQTPGFSDQHKDPTQYEPPAGSSPRSPRQEPATPDDATEDTPPQVSSVDDKNANHPPSPENEEQRDADQSALKEFAESELAELFPPCSEDTSNLSDAVGHASSTASCDASTIEEDQCMLKISSINSADDVDKLPLSQTIATKVLSTSRTKIIQDKEKYPSKALIKIPTFSLMELTTDNIVFQRHSILHDKDKLSPRLALLYRKHFREHDTLVIKSLLRLDAEDLIDIILPKQVMSDPFERRKNVLANLEAFFNRCHPIMDSEDILQRTSVQFVEARELSELVTPWADIDDAENKKRAGQFSRRILGNILPMKKASKIKGIMEVRNLVENFIEDIAVLSQSDHSLEMRSALRLEVFEKLEVVIPLAMTYSLQKRIIMEEKIGMLMKMLIPLREKSGEESNLQNGIEELLENIMFSVDIKLKVPNKNVIRSLVEEFLQSIQNVALMDDENERVSQFSAIIEKFMEAMLPYKLCEQSIRMHEIRKETRILLKNVIVAHYEECSSKLNYLKKIGRFHIARILYICEQSLRRKSSVLLQRSQKWLDVLVPETYNEEKSHKLMLEHWLQKLFESMILSLGNIGSVFKKSTLQKICMNFVESIRTSENNLDTTKRTYNTVQKLLETILPQSAAKNSIILNKVYQETEKLLHNVVPLLQTERNPASRCVLRFLAQEHMQYIFAVTEKVEKWECSFYQEIHDVRLNHIITEELLKNKEERKSVLIQGISELLESIILYEDMGSSVQKRKILYHIVEKFINDIEKVEYIEDKTTRANMLHRFVHTLVEIVIPSTVATDNIRSRDLWEKLINLLELPLISSFSEENMPKRHILRFIAMEYLNNIDPGRATKNDLFIQELQNEVLEYLIPVIHIPDSEKRKISLCKGIYNLLEEIIIMSKDAFNLDKKKLMHSVQCFVDDTPNVEKCLDKHKRKSQIFHKVEDLVQLINPSVQSGRCMHLSQLKKETIYFLETVILATSITDIVSRTVYRSSAIKHLQKIFLISSASRNSTVTLEKASEFVDNLIPYEYRDFNEMKGSWEYGIRELCEEIVVFVADTSDIQTNSDLLYVVMNLLRKIQSNIEWKNSDNEMQDISGIIDSFVQIILPNEESEDNIIKCHIIKEFSNLLTGVAYHALTEKNLSKRSTMRAIAIQHLQRIIPIIHRARTHTKKYKEILCELMPTESNKDQQKRIEVRLRGLQKLFENYILPAGIGPILDESTIHRAIQKFIENVQVSFLNREGKDTNKLTEIIQQLLSIILPEPHSTDIRIHKLRKELQQFLENIILYECCSSKRNTLTLATSKNLENILAVVEIIRKRKKRLVKLESRKFLGILPNISQNYEDSCRENCVQETNGTENIRNEISYSQSCIQKNLEHITPNSFTDKADHGVKTYRSQEDCIFKSFGESKGNISFHVSREENDVMTRTEIELTRNDSTSKSLEPIDVVKSHPAGDITSYVNEEMSPESKALEGDSRQQTDEISDEIIISIHQNIMKRSHTKLLDQIIPETFDLDEFKMQNSLKSGMKELLENVVLTGVGNIDNLNRKIENVVDRFIYKIITNPEIACNNNSERQILVTDLVEEIIPSDSEVSGDVELREETKTLIGNFVIPAISTKDIVKRGSLRLLAKELLEKIIQEPSIPQSNYESIMEKVFPNEVDELGNSLVLGVIELLEMIILFVNVKSPIQRRNVLHTIVKEFTNDMISANTIRNEESRIREKSLYILELVIKVIPDYVAMDNILIHRLQTELSHFFDITFINETYKDVERKQQEYDAQKTLQKIFSIISVFSRRDSYLRYQKYCEILEKLIPEEHLRGTPGMFSTVVQGIEELMENIILSMETQSDIEKRSELRMAAGAFMSTLQDLQEMGNTIPDRVKKLVVADFIKKIFPSASNRGSIHLLEVRKHSTSLLYNAVVLALDEEDIYKRKDLRSLAQEHLDSITLVEELWRKCIVTEDEVLEIVNKLLPRDCSISKEIRIRDIQHGIEVLIEKMILSMEDGRGVNMSSVHKFVQIMIDNISEFKDDSLITEKKYQVHKYIKHLIDGILSEDEAHDDIKKEKLRHTMVEILDEVLNIFLEKNTSCLNFTIVQDRLQTALSIIKDYQNKKLKNILRKETVQLIEKLIPLFYVEFESGREDILNNAMVEVLSEINFVEEPETQPKDTFLATGVQKLIMEMSSIGYVNNIIDKRRLTKKCVENFVNALLGQKNVSMNIHLRTIRCELQRLLEDVVFPAQTEKSYSKRQSLRQEGFDHLQLILISSRTAWKEIQLNEKRTMNIVDNMLPKVLQSNLESREKSLLSALNDTVEKITASEDPVMADDRIIHNRILEYVRNISHKKGDSGISTNDDEKSLLRKIIYDIIQLITNSLSVERTDIRLVSSCMEDLLFNIIPDGQYIQHIPQRIMLRSEARQLLDMVFFENDPSQDRESSADESDQSVAQNFSPKYVSARLHKKKRKSFINYIFPWTRKKMSKNSEEKKSKKVSKKKKTTAEEF